MELIVEVINRSTKNRDIFYNFANNLQKLYNPRVNGKWNLPIELRYIESFINDSVRKSPKKSLTKIFKMIRKIPFERFKSMLQAFYDLRSNFGKFDAILKVEGLELFSPV